MVHVLESELSWSSISAATGRNRTHLYLNFMLPDVAVSACILARQVGQAIDVDNLLHIDRNRVRQNGIAWSILRMPDGSRVAIENVRGLITRLKAVSGDSPSCPRCDSLRGSKGRVGRDNRSENTPHDGL